MKYLFHIVNVICIKSALVAIDQLFIQKSDCIFLIDKQFNAHNLIPEDIIIDTELLTNKNLSFCLNPFARHRNTNKYIIKTDDRIRKLTANCPYLFFATSLIQTICETVATNPNCLGIYFIEEGSISFLTEEQIQKYKSSNYSSFLLHKIALLGNSKRISFFSPFHNYTHKKYKGCISLLPNSFPSLKNKITASNIPKLSSNQILNGSILVVDNFLDVAHFTSHIYLLLIHQMIEDIKKQKIQTLSFKLHPAVSDSSTTRLFTALLSPHFEFVHQIDNSICLEDSSMNSCECDFWGLCSSALIYCAHFKPTITYAKQLAILDPKSANHNFFSMLDASSPPYLKIV